MGSQSITLTWVEDLFGDRHMQLLVSTATLGWWCELGSLDVLQSWVEQVVGNTITKVTVSSSQPHRVALVEFTITPEASAEGLDEVEARCVYVSPNQELADNLFINWQDKFASRLGKKVAMLTGETGTDLKLFSKANILISIPERWDVLSRRWNQRKNLQNVHLFIVDELQLLDGEDGPTLEVVCSRMRYIDAQLQKPIRLMRINVGEPIIGTAGQPGCPANDSFNFHSNVRTVFLEVHIQGFIITHNASRLIVMSKSPNNAISKHSPKKPVLVCH